MKKLILVLGAVSTIFSVACTAQNKDSREVAKNKAAITTFYGKALTVNNTSKPSEVLPGLLAEGYQSVSSSQTKGADKLIGQLGFFWKVVPDLKWQPQEIIHEGGDIYVVRSIASGTPKGNFMGTPTDGSKSFKMMTIDIHKMKDGKFISTKHVEDWATAMKQLKPKDDAMKIANAYMGAMGKGDMKTMMDLMHDDMVWQNAGDPSLPWMGPWKGKKVILEKFFPAFMKGFKTIKWEPNDALSSGNTAAYFGQMIGELPHSGKKTKEFTYALRVKVKDGKVILWNWFEDSYEVSKAFHGK